MTRSTVVYDAVIVGGGPAGLSAARWLARYRRRVRVFDTSEPRNELARAVHGFPGLPDLPPTELRRRMIEQALAAGAEYEPSGVTAIEGERDAFRAYNAAGPPVRARRLLLAFGRRDLIPEITGIEAVYGTSVFHCPDCDGPSVTGTAVGVIGCDRRAAALALFLLTWTDRLLLLGHGRPLELGERARTGLERAGIPIHTAGIARLHARGDRLAGVELDDGTTLPVDALFCHLGSIPACGLAEGLGCDCDEDGYLRTDAGHETSVPGIYAAGDVVGHPHLAIAAAADGVRAALAMHRSLLPPNFEL